MCWQEDEYTCRHCLTVNLFIPARRRVVARGTLNLNKIFIKSYARCKLSPSLLHSSPLSLHFLLPLLLHFHIQPCFLWLILSPLFSLISFEALHLLQVKFWRSVLSLFLDIWLSDSQNLTYALNLRGYISNLVYNINNILIIRVE